MDSESCPHNRGGICNLGYACDACPNNLDISSDDTLGDAGSPETRFPRLERTMRLDLADVEVNLAMDALLSACSPPAEYLEDNDDNDDGWEIEEEEEEDDDEFSDTGYPGPVMYCSDCGAEISRGIMTKIVISSVSISSGEVVDESENCVDYYCHFCRDPEGSRIYV